MMSTLIFMGFLGLMTAHVPSFFRGRPVEGIKDAGSRHVHRAIYGIEPKDKDAKDYPDVIKFQYDQKLVHSDNADTRTFKQTAWYNSHYIKNKPANRAFDVVFLWIEGEGRAADRWAGYGGSQYLQMAANHSAHAFQLEHRCFGNSRPFNNLEISTLELCRIDDALEDVAAFINAMNTQYKFASPKWVTFGASYSGVLSALFRQKYPELTVGAVASSAPLKLTFDMWDYAYSMQQTYSTISGCAENIKAAFTAIQQATLTKEGREKLNKDLPHDPPMSDATRQIDIDNFFSNVFTVFQDVVQYTFDGRNPDTESGARGINFLCRNISITSRSPIANVWNIIKYVNRLPQNAKFAYKYDDMIRVLRNTTFDDESSWLANASNRGWLWLTCQQLGFQQTTDLGRNIFGQILPINYYMTTCRDAFNLSFAEQIKRTTESRKKYAVGNLKATNIVLPNGSFDPWSTLGIHESDEANNLIAIKINGTSHCGDMYESYIGEPETFAPARAIIYDYVSRFIYN